jgi:hypothetical protein
MVIKGKLTKEMFGRTMPVTAPAFVEKPPYWRGATYYTFIYETDPEIVAQLAYKGRPPGSAGVAAKV